MQKSHFEVEWEYVMKRIATHQLNEFAEHDAVYFTEAGIIVDALTASPLLPFSRTVETLGINIEAVYLDNTVLVVQGQLPCSDHITIKDSFRVCPAKGFLTETNPHIQQQILRATHWLTWDTKLQYCSKCAGTLHKVDDLTEKQCTSCHLSFFPSLSPAVMVLIQREHEVLLARSAHFKAGIYSAIAGFIDLGETAEAAAHREVKEEVGVEISDLRYFGSQSWPFPSSFMIAFTAQYARGTLTIDDKEIEDARWFDLNNLPALPSYPSISRALIESVLEDSSTL